MIKASQGARVIVMSQHSAEVFVVPLLGWCTDEYGRAALVTPKKSYRPGLERDYDSTFVVLDGAYSYVVGPLPGAMPNPGGVTDYMREEDAISLADLY